MGDLSNHITAIKDAIETVPDMTLSPLLWDASGTPQTLTDCTYTLQVQSANTQKYRDRVRERIGHEVTVGIMFEVSMSDPFGTLTHVLDVEEQVMEAVLDQSKVPALFARYDATARTLLPTREWLLSEITFQVEGDHTL